MIWWIWKRHIKCRMGFHFTLGKEDKKFCLVCSEDMF